MSVLVVSCTKEEDKELDPTLTLDGGTQYVASDREIEPGTNFSVRLTANKGADGSNIDKLEVKVSYAGAVATTDTMIQNINQSSYTFIRNLRTRDVEGSERWIFTVTDKDGKTAERSFTLTVKKKTTNPTAPKAFTINLSQNGNAFASSSDGQTYNATNAQANASKVDLTYFYSGTSQNNMASAEARKNTANYATFAITWGVVQTEFKRVNTSTADFDALNDQTRLKTIFDGGTSTTVVQNPDGTRFNTASGDFLAGKVIAFLNKSTGKYGLMKIVSVASDANGSCSIQLKVEN